MDIKQMKLPDFCKSFDVPRSTAIEWLHESDLPAYKISGRWYIDIDEYYHWRKLQHRNCYKYY